MAAYLPKPFKVIYGLREILDMNDARPARRLYTYAKDEDIILPQFNTINLVLGRDVRKNTRTAADLAVGIAIEHPERRVIYVNTYAGNSLLKEAIVYAFRQHDVIVPPEVDVQEWKNQIAEARSKGEPIEEDLPRFGLGNMMVIHAPMGGWNTHGFQKYWQNKYKGAIVIMNSFEFATTSPYRRAKMAHDIIEETDTSDLTWIIFSSDPKKEILPRMMGRGPIGMLTACADTVFRVKDDVEKLRDIAIKEREAKRRARDQAKLQKEIERGYVHEYETPNYSGAVVTKSMGRPGKPGLKMPAMIHSQAVVPTSVSAQTAVRGAKPAAIPILY